MRKKFFYLNQKVFIKEIFKLRIEFKVKNKTCSYKKNGLLMKFYSTL